MTESSEKPKYERKKTRKTKSPFDLEKKAKAVMESKLPDSEKAKYLERLGMNEVEKTGVPFNVYAQIKKIPVKIQSAMLAYPKAKGVEVATTNEWDSIFKDF